MKYITLVIGYQGEDPAAVQFPYANIPRFAPNMKCLGGIIQSVSFYDSIKKLEDVESELEDANEYIEDQTERNG